MENKLIDLTKDFSVEIIRLCRVIREERNERVLVNKLLRSGTSIGANVHEANYASSRADFINKFQIALKECYETEYWLEIFMKSDYITQEEYNFFYSQCSKARKILSTSIITAKNNAVE
ncbi:MAG: four helix bundle protein [Clostridia bacterium]|nr:four helix bundle protein [Clostridia bacterium]